MGSLFPIVQEAYRLNGGSYVNGIWQEGTREDFTFLGTIQPMTGKEIESMVGARETQGMVKIYTGDDLQVSKEGTDETGDIIIFDEAEYELVKEMPYTSNLINHRKYAAAFRKYL